MIKFMGGRNTHTHTTQTQVGASVSVGALSVFLLFMFLVVTVGPGSLLVILGVLGTITAVALVLAAVHFVREIAKSMEYNDREAATYERRLNGAGQQTHGPTITRVSLTKNSSDPFAEPLTQPAPRRTLRHWK